MIAPFAIVSDIHSNLDALRSVLADIEAQGVKRIVCLGDVVGYGPEPLECLKIAMSRFEFCLMGNHEFAVLHGATEDYSEISRESLEWTHGRIKGFFKRKYWKYISNMEERRQTGPLAFVHASPRNPVFEYVINENVAKANFAFVARGENEPYLKARGIAACFVGHTHQPAVFLENGQGRIVKGEEEWILDHQDRAIVNIGSVGQPRDGDVRASYVIVDGNLVKHRRVEYDFRLTMSKIKAIDALDPWLADRLALGK